LGANSGAAYSWREDVKEYFKKLSIQLIGTAVGGVIAIGGSLYIYTLQQKTFAVNKKVENLAILRQEIGNIAISAEEFLEDTLYRQDCVDPRGQSPIKRGDHQKRAAFRVFDVSAWNARSTYVPEAEYSQYAAFYSKVTQANYIAQKIQYGEYQTAEGVFFLQAAHAIYQLRSTIEGVALQDTGATYEIGKDGYSLKRDPHKNCMQRAREDGDR
jgi:hypothetical protein